MIRILIACIGSPNKMSLVARDCSGQPRFDIWSSCTAAHVHCTPGSWIALYESTVDGTGGKHMFCMVSLVRTKCYSFRSALWQIMHRFNYWNMPQMTPSRIYFLNIFWRRGTHPRLGLRRQISVNITNGNCTVDVGPGIFRLSSEVGDNRPLWIDICFPLNPSFWPFKDHSIWYDVSHGYSLLQYTTAKPA
jgi:hypothetical protein